MKKLLTILLAALLCVCCVSMVACKGETGVEGTYKIYSITYGGKTYGIGDEFQGLEITEDVLQIELKKDGTANISEDIYTTKATWTKDGNNVIISFDDITLNTTINGIELTWVEEPDTPFEIIYVFKKA